VPGGGHIASEFGKGVTRTFKELADGYGLSNLNTASPSRSNRAMPWHPNAATQPDPSLGIKTFAPGFASYFHPSKPTCMPSLQQPHIPVRPMVGQRLEMSPTVASPTIRGRQGLNSRIESRHYPK
jgi:hypothetical protein